MQLFKILKLKIGLYLLNHKQLNFVDVWYYSHRLNKECVLTFTRTAGKINQERWKRDLITSVMYNKSHITYVHFGDTML